MYFSGYNPATCEFTCVLLIQSCSTLCDPMDHGLLGSSIHGDSPAKILEWVAVPSSRGSSWPRDQTHISHVSCTGRWVVGPLLLVPYWEAHLWDCLTLSSFLLTDKFVMHQLKIQISWLLMLKTRLVVKKCPSRFWSGSACCPLQQPSLAWGNFLFATRKLENVVNPELKSLEVSVFGSSSNYKSDLISFKLF